jgi:GMP synthase-like glutamine amidotransferase
VPRWQAGHEAPVSRRSGRASDGAQERPWLLVLEYQPTCPAGLLVDAAAAAAVDLRVLDASDGAQVPAGLGGAAGLVILGGELAAYDPHPTVAASLALIRVAAAQAAPTLGICLGAQLAARALGGRAYRDLEAGLELGWVPVEVTAAGRTDSVVGQLGDPAEAFDWHRDTFSLPPGAVLLARSATYPQAFRLGSVVGVQFHPEADARLVASWYDGQAAAAAEAGYPLTAAVAGAERQQPAMQRLLAAFCRTAAA